MRSIHISKRRNATKLLYFRHQTGRVKQHLQGLGPGNVISGTDTTELISTKDLFEHGGKFCSSKEAGNILLIFLLHQLVKQTLEIQREMNDFSRFTIFERFIRTKVAFT